MKRKKQQQVNKAISRYYSNFRDNRKHRKHEGKKLYGPCAVRSPASNASYENPKKKNVMAKQSVAV